MYDALNAELHNGYYKKNEDEIKMTQGDYYYSSKANLPGNVICIFTGFPSLYAGCHSPD
jgi:hypothetical protein